MYTLTNQSDWTALSTLGCCNGNDECSIYTDPTSLKNNRATFRPHGVFIRDAITLYKKQYTKSSY